MKNEMLVTTDFSANSKAGIRFAIQLASQHKMALVFLHVIELLIPTRWNDVKAKVRENEELDAEKKKLEKFVRDIYRQSGATPGPVGFVARYGAPVNQAIIDYAIERKVDYICMSTRGAGGVKRIFGTHTSAVLRRSPVPVFVIPDTYRRRPVKDLLYACDLEDVKGELQQVRAVAEKVKGKVHVLHFEGFARGEEKKAEFDKVARRYTDPKVKFHLDRFDWEESLTQHLKKAISKFQPSVIVLFTNQSKNWYERLFRPSESADMSYDTKLPLLVFPKRGE